MTAIVNSSGCPVVNYTYNAWGKLLRTTGSMTSTLGAQNPLRYRGYVYDTDTGLYYLQSRYCNPEMGRFINADSYASTGQGILGNNMFAYCNNNPANMVDVNGNWPKWLDEFVDWIDNATEGLEEKVEDVLEAGWKSLEVSAGIGLGLFGGASLFDDFLGIELGMYYDVFNISLADGSFSVQEYGYIGTSVSVLIPVWEYKEERYRPYGQNTPEWSDLDQATDAVPLFGTGIYLFGGGNFSIGFDFGKFCRMVDAIF